MKVYTTFTPSHKVLYENYFLKTLPDEFEVKAYEIPQECNSGDFYSDGWDKTCYRKVELFYKACEENMGDIFVYLDVDIQFFGNIKNILIEELGDFDIACQDDISHACSGQFICRCTDRTLNMFANMKEHYRLEDQTTLNDHIWLCRNKFLSRRFFSFGHVMTKPWSEEDFNIPENIVSHHANWVIGIDNKIKIMDIVREKYNKMKGNHG